jgi:hypothetical protein
MHFIFDASPLFLQRRNYAFLLNRLDNPLSKRRARFIVATADLSAGRPTNKSGPTMDVV